MTHPDGTQNLHLAATEWLNRLSDLISTWPAAPNTHKEFLCFLVTEQATHLPDRFIRQLTKYMSEPQHGLKTQFRNAFVSLSDSVWETSSRSRELKSVVFATCFLHTLCVERARFGAQVRRWLVRSGEICALGTADESGV